jgi:hypothetical protein
MGIADDPAAGSRASFRGPRRAAAGHRDRAVGVSGCDPAIEVVRTAEIRLCHNTGDRRAFNNKPPSDARGPLNSFANVAGEPGGMLSYSESRRIFLRFRFLASACFMRFFSPGFR